MNCDDDEQRKTRQTASHRFIDSRQTTSLLHWSAQHASFWILAEFNSHFHIMITQLFAIFSESFMMTAATVCHNIASTHTHTYLASCHCSNVNTWKLFSRKKEFSQISQNKHYIFQKPVTASLQPQIHAKLEGYSVECIYLWQRCSHGSRWTKLQSILKPCLAAAMLRRVPSTYRLDFPNVIKFHATAHMISEKAIWFRHPDYNADPAQNLISSSMSRHLSTCNI